MLLQDRIEPDGNGADRDKNYNLKTLYTKFGQVGWLQWLTPCRALVDSKASRGHYDFDKSKKYRQSSKKKAPSGSTRAWLKAQDQASFYVLSTQRVNNIGKPVCRTNLATRSTIKSVTNCMRLRLLTAMTQNPKSTYNVYTHLHQIKRPYPKWT